MYKDPRDRWRGVGGFAFACTKSCKEREKKRREGHSRRDCAIVAVACSHEAAVGLVGMCMLPRSALLTCGVCACVWSLSLSRLPSAGRTVGDESERSVHRAATQAPGWAWSPTVGHAILCALSAYAPSELHVFRQWHDGDALGVYGAQVGILEEADQIRLRNLLQGQDGRRPETRDHNRRATSGQHQGQGQA